MWLTWLKIKNKFFGLTPLQRFIVANHEKYTQNYFNSKTPSPFILYLYFYTYENEIAKRIDEANRMQAKMQVKRQIEQANGTAQQDQIPKLPKKEKNVSHPYKHDLGKRVKNAFHPYGNDLKNGVKNAFSSSEENKKQNKSPEDDADDVIDTDDPYLDAYVDCVEALYSNPKSHQAENTTFKVFLHMMSMFFVWTLMISASAVQTDKVMEWAGGGFGSYGYIAQAFFFLTALGAQWFIYGKKAPEVLKKFFYGIFTKNWHFTKNRVLTIKNGHLVCDDTTPEYSKGSFFFWLTCTAVLSASLGMILLNTVMKDDNIFDRMELVNGVSQVFGGVDGFGWLLFVSYIFCNFALYASATLRMSFEKSKAENEKQNKSKLFLGAFAFLIFVNLFGLMATMVAQTKSTFDGSWNLHHGETDLEPDNLIVQILFPFVVIACALGRIRFNINESMRNVGLMISEAWECREDLKWRMKNDLTQNWGSYLVAALCVGACLTMFGLMGGFGYETGLDIFKPELKEGASVISQLENIWPLLATFGGSVLIYGFFQTCKRYLQYNIEERDYDTSKNDGYRHSQNVEYTNQEFSTQHTFLFHRDSNSIGVIKGSFIIGGNMIGAACLAKILGKAITNLYGGKENAALHDALLVFTIISMIGGAVMSAGSVLNGFKVRTGEEKNTQSVHGRHSLPMKK